MQYPKTQTLFKRTQPYKQPKKIIIGDYAHEAFGNIKLWRVQEKIDGMNIRVYFEGDSIKIMGRGEDSQIPPSLQSFFDSSLILENYKLLCLADPRINNIQLFGEGFGGKIQKGRIYRNDPAFILFDTLLNGRWGTREEVGHIAICLGLEQPHDYGLKTEEEIVDIIQNKNTGRYNFDHDRKYIFEGVIARTDPYLFDRDGNRIMFKLKVEDFKNV
jgi:hypothetical protein